MGTVPGLLLEKKGLIMALLRERKMVFLVVSTRKRATHSHRGSHSRIWLVRRVWLDCTASDAASDAICTWVLGSIYIRHRLS